MRCGSRCRATWTPFLNVSAVGLLAKQEQEKKVGGATTRKSVELGEFRIWRADGCVGVGQDGHGRSGAEKWRARSVCTGKQSLQTRQLHGLAWHGMFGSFHDDDLWVVVSPHTTRPPGRPYARRLEKGTRTVARCHGSCEIVPDCTRSCVCGLEVVVDGGDDGGGKSSSGVGLRYKRHRQHEQTRPVVERSTSRPYRVVVVVLQTASCNMQGHAFRRRAHPKSTLAILQKC